MHWRSAACDWHGVFGPRSGLQNRIAGFNTRSATQRFGRARVRPVPAGQATPRETLGAQGGEHPANTPLNNLAVRGGAFSRPRAAFRAWRRPPYCTAAAAALRCLTPLLPSHTMQASQTCPQPGGASRQSACPQVQPAAHPMQRAALTPRQRGIRLRNLGPHPAQHAAWHGSCCSRRRRSSSRSSRSRQLVAAGLPSGLRQPRKLWCSAQQSRSSDWRSSRLLMWPLS